MEHNFAAVTTGLTLPWSSSPTEGTVNKLKTSRGNGQTMCLREVCPLAAGIPFAWFTADEAYGQADYLRDWLADRGGRVDELPATSWQRLSVGAGAHGPIPGRRPAGLVCPHHPVDARPGPARGIENHCRKTGLADSGEDMVALALPEIRCLLVALVLIATHTTDHIRSWSRRRHQARLSHYRRRGRPLT